MSQNLAYDRLATEVGILQEGWWARKKERKRNVKTNIRIKPHAQNKKQETRTRFRCSLHLHHPSYTSFYLSAQLLARSSNPRTQESDVICNSLREIWKDRSGGKATETHDTNTNYLATYCHTYEDVEEFVDGNDE